MENNNELFIELEDKEWQYDFIDHDRVIARAVVFDEEKYLYLISAHRDDIFGNVDFVETSGGGVEEGEEITKALERELKEELGADVEIISKLGVVSDYYNLIHRHNINYYYLCKTKAFGKNDLTYDELHKFNLKTIRITPEDAIRLYENQKSTKLGRLITNREIGIIKKAISLIEKL